MKALLVILCAAFDMKAAVSGVAHTIRAVKSDQAGPRLQQEFFEGSRQPATKR
jgi:hypothetical protein